MSFQCNMIQIITSLNTDVDEVYLSSCLSLAHLIELGALFSIRPISVTRIIH